MMEKKSLYISDENELDQLPRDVDVCQFCPYAVIIDNYNVT